MLSSSPRIVRFVPLFLLLGLGTGCSEKSGNTMSGKVVLPAGVKLGKGDTLTVGFVPDPPVEGKMRSAPVNPDDLTFAVKDVGAGKYKVTVSATPYPGQDAKHGQALQAISDKHNVASTKLRYEATNESSQSVTIDLSKDTVSKG